MNIKKIICFLKGRHTLGRDFKGFSIEEKGGDPHSVRHVIVRYTCSTCGEKQKREF
ncbi:hypothetical protein ES703_33196 [subsurface metagenome]